MACPMSPVMRPLACEIIPGPRFPICSMGSLLAASRTLRSKKWLGNCLNVWSQLEPKLFSQHQPDPSQQSFCHPPPHPTPSPVTILF